jgi:acetyl-CoA carboxylase biotin carboxyl carrier protein
VGTFYCAPEPGAEPYVEVGQVVEKGQMLCIVEAMKLMNEIEAEFRCKILRVCKENAQPVEFSEPLFIVERL